MDSAAHLARVGAAERTVVVSGEQTDGRGRGGRSWHAPAGDAVFCTIILRPQVPPDRLSTLPLVSGVAVAEAIEQVAGARVQLKWPNDVWIGADTRNAKVAGILVTSSLRGRSVDHVLVGIGINVSARPDTLPPGATSVQAATGRATTPAEVLAALLDRFAQRYDDYLAADGRPSLTAWRERAALVGQPITVEDAGQRLGGIFRGVDDEGALLLEEPDGQVRKIMAGDVVRGPRLDHGLEA